MKRDELLNLHSEITEKAKNLMDKKNRDYAGNDGLEPFANFTRVESMGICSTEKGMLVRMTDKMSRLSSFFESGELHVKDESFEDTIVDIINYSVLIYAYRKDKEPNIKPSCCNKMCKKQILLVENYLNNISDTIDNALKHE
jgi:hypothetical protein